LRVFEPYPQVLQNVRIDGGGAPLEDSSVRDAIDAASNDLGESGRVLVRASGTEPLIRVMVEGQDMGVIQKTADHLCDVIKRAAA